MSFLLPEDNLYAFSRAAILGEKSEVGKDMKDRFKYTGLASYCYFRITYWACYNRNCENPGYIEY